MSEEGFRPNLHAMGLLDASTNTAQQGSFLDDTLQGALHWATKLLGLPNLDKAGTTGIQHVAGGDTQGLHEKMIMPKAGTSLERPNGVFAQLKKYFTRELPAGLTDGVEAGEVHSNAAATEIAAASSPDFKELLGDASAHGQYSVRDMAGGDPVAPGSIPNMGDINYNQLS